jgi:hypothetical protein
MIPVILAEATTPAAGVQNALQTGFQSIASDMTTTVTNVLPIILGVVGLVLVVGFAIRFFKKNASPTK